MTQCFADSAICDRIFLPFNLVRYSCLPSDEQVSAKGGRKSLWGVCVCVMLGPAVLCNP